MTYIEFANKWNKQRIFNINELRAWNPNFDRNNLTRWISKGYLIRLKNGWYALDNVKEMVDYDRLAAVRIYNPSYISLQTALSIYDIIPEVVTDITCVTSLKTARFFTPLGRFYYYSVKESLMFGYKPVSTPDGRTYMLALPEKAILDFLYLMPMYKTEADMIELRFDEDFMATSLNRNKLYFFLEKFHNRSLEQRVNKLLITYPND